MPYDRFLQEKHFYNRVITFMIISSLSDKYSMKMNGVHVDRLSKRNFHFDRLCMYGSQMSFMISDQLMRDKGKGIKLLRE